MCNEGHASRAVPAASTSAAPLLLPIGPRLAPRDASMPRRTAHAAAQLALHAAQQFRVLLACRHLHSKSSSNFARPGSRKSDDVLNTAPGEPKCAGMQRGGRGDHSKRRPGARPPCAAQRQRHNDPAPTRRWCRVAWCPASSANVGCCCRWPSLSRMGARRRRAFSLPLCCTVLSGLLVLCTAVCLAVQFAIT